MECKKCYAKEERPVKTKRKSTQVHFVIEPEIYDVVTSKSKEWEVSIGEVLRWAIRNSLIKK